MEEMTNDIIIESYDTFKTLISLGKTEKEAFLIASEYIIDETVNSFFQMGADDFEIDHDYESNPEEEYTDGYAEAVDDIYLMLKTYREVFGFKNEED